MVFLVSDVVVDCSPLTPQVGHQDELVFRSVLGVGYFLGSVIGADLRLGSVVE